MAADDICGFAGLWAGMAAAAGAHPLAGTVSYDFYHATGTTAPCCDDSSSPSYKMMSECAKVQGHGAA